MDSEPLMNTKMSFREFDRLVYVGEGRHELEVRCPLRGEYTLEVGMPVNDGWNPEIQLFKVHSFSYSSLENFIANSAHRF